MYILRNNVQVIISTMMFLISIRNVDSLGTLQQKTLISDIVDSNIIEKFAIKLLDNIENSKVMQINDFVSIETIGNSTYKSGPIERREARFLEKLNDVTHTKSLNLNFGIFDLKMFRDEDSELNVDLKLHPRNSKDKKGGGILLPLLIGLKATTFIVGTVSIIALLTLKAFIASKTAILIATVLGLKKLFGGHHKTTYEAVYDAGHSSGGPDYHYINEHHYEPEIFKGHAEIPEQKLLGVYDLLKDQSELIQDNKEPPKFEFNAQELQGSPELIKSPDYGPQQFSGSMQQDFKIDNHQKRRSWMINNGKRKPLSLVIGSPHHEPAVLAYRKVVTGRNS